MADEPVGFNLDLDKILRDTGITKPKRGRTSTTTADAAIRRAVRLEVAGIERAIKTLAEEVARLRRANEDLADRISRLDRR